MTTNCSNTPACESGGTYPNGLSAAVAWILLVLLLVTNLPLFLCMPLTDDAAMYDLQAVNWLRGGMLYRDILEPNLPGVIWIHAAVRGMLGTSSVALRSVDLLLFIAFVALSRNWLVRLRTPPAVVAWSVLGLFLCYFSLSEWCHCQRDIWLLVPGLAGLTLRRRQIQRLRFESQFTQPPTACPETAHAPVASWAFFEGICWGIAVWLKPMIVLPAVCVWTLSALDIRNRRRSLVDLLGLLAGGLLVGGLGVAALVWAGAWPFFFDTLREWNPRYMAAAREQWTWARFVAMQVRFFPWQLLHLAAIPVALTAVGRALDQWWRSGRVPESKQKETDAAACTRADASNARVLETSGCLTVRLFDSSTLSVFYLAWLVQSYWLQHLFDYVHAPAVLLAIVVLGAARVRSSLDVAAVDGGHPAPDDYSSGLPTTNAPLSRWGKSWRRLALAGFIASVLLSTPVIRLGRLSCWSQCVSQGSTAEVRDRLKYFSVPNWRELTRVAEYLRCQRVNDRDVTCYNSSAVHLYGILGLRPSTRFVYLEQLAAYFPERQSLFLRALSDSPQRYVVTDLIASGLSPEGIARLCPEGELVRPPRFPSRLQNVYPWSQPAAFRAGPYLVHRVQPPLGRLAAPPKSP